MTALTTGQPQSFTFRDMKNQTCRIKVHLAPTTATLMATAMLNLSVDLHAISASQYVTSSDGTANVLVSRGPFNTPEQPWLGASTSPADYVTIADKARFAFSDAAGKLHFIEVPCPLDSIFQADKTTIDFSVSIVKQFVADVLNATFSGTAPTAGSLPLTSAQGNAFLTSVGGTRVRRKIQRRFNIYTRNPALTGQGL